MRRRHAAHADHLRVRMRYAHWRESGGVHHPAERHRARAASEGLDVSYGVRPEHLSVVQGAGEGTVSAEVIVVEPTGPQTELLVRSGTSQITVVSHRRASINPGDQIALAVAPGSVHVFDQKSGMRIQDRAAV